MIRRQMKIIGLTGGIGMGKSTAATCFTRLGVPVFDADRAVHRLQAPGGAALPAIAGAFPGSVVNGTLNRAVLRAAVLGNGAALRTLETIMHPLVRRAQNRFLARARNAGKSLVVLDVPLLFETGGNRLCDHVVVVSAPRDVQQARVARRGTMTIAQIGAIIALQMPDARKRRLADTVIRTGLSRFHATRAIRRLVHFLRERPKA